MQVWRSRSEGTRSSKSLRSKLRFRKSCGKPQLDVAGSLCDWSRGGTGPFGWRREDLHGADN